MHKAILHKVADKSGIVDLIESFFFEGDYVIVLEKLGSNLYQKISKDRPRGMEIEEVRLIGE